MNESTKTKFKVSLAVCFFIIVTYLFQLSQEKSQKIAQLEEIISQTKSNLVASNRIDQTEQLASNFYPVGPKDKSQRKVFSTTTTDDLIIKQPKEKNYNGKQFNCSKTQQLLSTRGVATSFCDGQLGNQLGLLSLGLAVNLQFGTKTALSETQWNMLALAVDLDEVCMWDGSSFCVKVSKDCELPKMPEEKKIRLSKDTLWERGLKGIGEVPGDVEGKQIILPDYPQYLPWITTTFYAEFRERIKIKDSIWQDAHLILNHLSKMYNCTPDNDCTRVFVHMRMGEYPEHLKNMNAGPDLFGHTNYLQNAFRNVSKTYKNPVFHILGYTTSDVENFFQMHEKDFQGLQIVIVEPIQRKVLGSERKNLIGVDLALMALSDVLVLSYGTYGNFGALFGRDKQRVLFPKGHKEHFHTGVIWPGLPRYVPIAWLEQN